MATPSQEELQREVDRNYAAFEKRLPEIIEARRGEFALMRGEEIVEFFETVRDAHAAGAKLYEDGLFSVQEVTYLRP